MIQLSDDLVAELDQEAKLRGCSRSAVVRQAVREHLTASTTKGRLAQYIDGYRALPQGAVDGWGDVQDDLARTRRSTARRLDAEEEAAGMQW